MKKRTKAGNGIIVQCKIGGSDENPEVIVLKKRELLGSLFFVAILMLISSLLMYSAEHDAQPEVFRNAFSGLWWVARE